MCLVWSAIQISIFWTNEGLHFLRYKKPGGNAGLTQHLICPKDPSETPVLPLQHVAFSCLSPQYLKKDAPCSSAQLCSRREEEGQRAHSSPHPHLSRFLIIHHWPGWCKMTTFLTRKIHFAKHAATLCSINKGERRRDPALVTSISPWCFHFPVTINFQGG